MMYELGYWNASEKHAGRACGAQVEDEDGLMVLDEDGDQADFEVDAILAWAHVPSFAMDQAAAQETDLLLRRVKNAFG